MPDMGENETMRKVLALAVAWVSASAFGGNGWIQLFNGSNLDGWAVAGASGRSAFATDDGSIRTQPGSGLLWYTREKIGDGTLRIIYKLSSPECRSAVLLHLPSEPNSEVAGGAQGSFVPIDSANDAAKPVGEWNTMDIAMNGAHLRVKLNGVLISDSQGATGAGYVALRHPDARTTMYIREISIRRP